MSNITGEQLPEGKHPATVLVADLNGFAALTEQLDEDKFSRLITETWRGLYQVIYDHGGYITKHLGDEIVAVWGLPEPAGGDAVRAVNCALALQNRLSDFSVNSRMVSVGKLKLKIGIYTGSVFISRIGLKNEPIVIGETLNMARRLSELTDSDKILIGQSTFHLIHGLFRVYRAENLLVRGSPDPMVGYFIEARHDQPTRVRYTGTSGLETRMVGREGAFKSLVGLFDPLYVAADPFLVLITGVEGIGKSRLMLEYSREIESAKSHYNLMFVRGDAEARRSPFYLLKILWKHRFSIRDDMDEEEARDVLLRGVLKMWGKRLGKNSAIEAAHFIGELIGLPWRNSPYLGRFDGNPGLRNAHAFELIRDLFVRMADTGPLILMLDDLQWMDTGSLELLLHLLGQSADPLQLVVVASTSTEYLELFPEWKNLAYKIINLEPIPFSSKMVEEAYPSLVRLPEALVARMIERSGGNPLYLEEIVKHIHFDRLARNESPEKLPSVAYPIPKTIRGLLQTRLDQISQPAREVLQLASVSGRIFWRGGIIAAARQPVGTGLLNLPIEVLEGVVDEAMKEIIHAELAFPRMGLVFDGEQEYIFKHALLQEVSYGILPEKYRKFYHFAIAKWLGMKAGADMQAFIGSHFEKAGNISSALRAYQYALELARISGLDVEAERLKKQILEIRRTETPAKEDKLY